MTRSPARRALRIAGILAAVAFVALLVYGITSKATNSTIDDALSRGESVEAPGFTLSKLADGQGARGAWTRAAADGEVSLRELRGTPLVLNFWASWCDPCRAEAKLLEKTWKRHGKDGVLFVGLDAQDAREDARDFIGADGRVVGHVIGTVDEQQLADGIAAAKEGRPVGAEDGGEQRPVD